MEELVSLKQSLTSDRPVKWESLPDFALYMDQVISYMSRQYMEGETDAILTSAMVNNYIKEGLLPRAQGKRYFREHLAHLTAICQLKQVLSVSDVKLLLRGELDDGADVEHFYNDYCALLDASLMRTAQSVEENADIAVLSHMALELAIASYTNKLACEKLLSIIRNKG